ncbi:tolB protein precursor protein [Rubrivirga sp. IMCC43871]|uniref:tolB protein precursor protein n=1 Tax=Rubrivirga sp. IMCC43871 TaxID=3391575 RepID=UPI00398FE887
MARISWHPIDPRQPERESLPSRFAAGVVLALVAVGGCTTADAPLPADELAALPGALVFASERDAVRGVYRLDFSAETVRLSPLGADEVPLAVSPDGAALVVGRAVPVEGGALEQLVLVEGDTAQALTPPRRRARHPAWSPDGQWLVFESDLDGFSDVYRVDRQGGALTRLTANVEGNFEPTVSPDGAAILFSSSRDQQAEIYRMRSDGTTQTRLPASPRDEWRARWSPDGRSVVVLSNERGRDELYLMSADGIGRRRLNATRTDAGAAEVLEAEPTWSPDGGSLAYSTRTRTGAGQVWRLDLADGQHHALTDTTSLNGSPEWSPDGRYLAFVSNRDGDGELYVMRADGSGLTRLTTSLGEDWMPRWVPASP